MKPEPVTRPQRRERNVRHIESPRRMADRQWVDDGDFWTQEEIDAAEKIALSRLYSFWRNDAPVFNQS